MYARPVGIFFDDEQYTINGGHDTNFENTAVSCLRNGGATGRGLATTPISGA